MGAKGGGSRPECAGATLGAFSPRSSAILTGRFAMTSRLECACAWKSDTPVDSICVSRKDQVECLRPARSRQTCSFPDRENDASTDEYGEDVRHVVGDQARRSQIENVTEEEAHMRFEEKLPIAFVAAMAKCVCEDATVEVRMVHDGMNGVGTNGAIWILHHVAGMRCQLASGIPYYAATADVKEGHCFVRAHPGDSGYQACVLTPGGLVMRDRLNFRE